MKTNILETEKMTTEEQYVAPQVEIVELDTTQSVLSGSIPDLPGENW